MGRRRAHRSLVTLVAALVVTLGPLPPAEATHVYPDAPGWVDAAVSWADANGYLVGYADGTFRTGSPMTRAQFARFVYRTRGAPPVDGLGDHGFSDVPPWVDAAVTWLAAQGLVDGFADGTFRPDDAVRRGQATRLVHRLAGSPAAVAPHGLTDVPPWLEAAVSWVTDDPPGTASPLMTGFADATFRSDDVMTRGQATRVLYRHARTQHPALDVAVIAGGLTVPWGLAVLPDGRLLFNERAGGISLRETDGTVHAVAADLDDLFTSGETGLMGIVADPAFVTNRRFYQCQGHAGAPATIQVVAWELAADGLSAVRVADPLVPGLPVSSGRHGGCRLRFGNEDQLWIATGDAAVGTNPQNLASAGGKVLRVDPGTGAGTDGNPFDQSADATTRRIYTYGHRNLQGLALRPGTDEMWSVEHGPSRDDEVNRLTPGGNAGWNPVPGYDESVPMTDLVAFPGAMVAIWSSGAPTLATSGAAFVDGVEWRGYEGGLAVATLKRTSVRILRLDAAGAFVDQAVPPELDGTHGRLRTVERGPDGALYVTTGNGGGTDRILRVTPAAG